MHANYSKNSQCVYQ